MFRVLAWQYFTKLTWLLSVSLCFSISTFSFADTELNYEKALSAYKESRFDESMIHLENALQLSPDNHPSKILMGKLLVQLGQFNAAKIEFAEVMSQGADVSLFADTWGAVLMRLKAYQAIIDFNLFTGLTKKQQLNWQRLRSIACIQRNDYKCATESVFNIEQLSTDKTEKFNGLANIELSQKNYVKAQSYLQQSSNINPKNATTWHLRGLVARNQNNLSLSLSYLQKSFELAPDEPYILRNLADVYLISNNNEAAKKTISSMLDAPSEAPSDILINSWSQKNTTLKVQAKTKFSDLATRINNLPTELVEEEPSLLFIRALIAFRQQNYEQAMRDFIILRKLDNSNISPIFLLAKSYIILGKEKDAIAILESNQEGLTALPDILVMLGDLYINNGRNFKAFSLLQTLNNDYATNVQVRLLDAKLEIARGKTSQGLNSLDKLASEYPSNEVVLFVHGVLNMQAHRYLKADTSITRLIKLRPNDATNLNIKGAILIKFDLLNEAKEYITQALSINPNLLSAKFNLATVLFLQNDIEQTLILLEEILKENPRYPSALLLLAKIQVAKQQYDDAQANYRKLLNDDKKNIKALEGLTSLHLAKDEKHEAIFQLRKSSKIQSDNPKYIIQKAHIYLGLGDKENSQREIQTLRLVSQDDAELLVALSKLQLLADDLPGAIKSLESAQNLQPNSLPVGFQIAELLLNNNLTADAATQIKLLVKTFNQSPKVSFLQGQLAEQQNNISQASQFYIAALNNNDQFELALAKLYALMTKGLPPQAFKTQIDKIIDKYPERYFPRNLLAQYYFDQKDYTQAAIHYEQLLNHKDLPNRAVLLNRLANAYMPSDSVKSIQIAKQAYELDKTNLQILTTYGWLLTQQQQPDLGLELLRKAFSRNQQNPALHYYIAVSLDKLGLHTEAKSELETLLKQEIDFPEREKSQVLYDKLSKSEQT